jgi:hypothetical protein
MVPLKGVAAGPMTNAGPKAVSDTETALSLDFLSGPPTFVIGAMWSVFAISYAIYDLASASKTADFALYASMAVATPIAGYLAFRISERIKTQRQYGPWFATFTFGIIAISTFARSAISLFSLVAIYLITVSAVLFFQRTNDAPRTGTLSRWIANLAAAVSVACFLRLALTNLNPYFYWPDHDGMGATRYGPNIGRVLAGAAVALIVILLIRLSARALENTSRHIKIDKARFPLWVFSACLIGYLLICPIPSFESVSYGPYLGALHLLRHGGWPLVEVFCQYGLSFLAYLPLGLLLPFNYAAAALVTNLFNIAMLLVALAIIYTLTNRCKFALPVAAILTIVIWLSLPYNLNATPSVFGVRWLPAWILSWVLVRNTTFRQASARVWAVLLLNLAAVWSLETHIVAVIVFGLHAALVSRMDGSSPRRAVVQALAAVPLSLVGYGLIIAATLIGRGRLPAYGAYLEIFQFHLGGGDPYLFSNWLQLAKSNITTNIWLLFAATYAGLIFLALSSFMLGRSLFMPAPLLIGLSTLAFTGTAQSFWVISRPTQPLLVVSALPLYTILVCLLILFIDRVAAGRRGLKYELAFFASACLVAFPMGYAWDRIHREYNGGFLFGSSNASLLVRCIQFSECNPIRELGSVAGSIREDAPSPFDSPSSKQRIADLVALYKKWQDAAPSIAMVAQERTPALVKLGVQDALRANDLTHDFMSPTVTRKLATALDRTPAGALVMTVNSTTGPHEIGLLCGLLKQYRFERLDSAGDASVDRLVPLDYEFEVGSRVTQIDDKVFLRLKDGSAVPVKTRPTHFTAGFAEQFRVRRRTAIVSGWAIDPSTLAPAKTVVMTLHDRIWGLARPGIARSDIAGMNPNFLNSGFRLYACDVDQPEAADFRAYAWSGSGSATELEYSPGVLSADLR